MPGAEPSEDVAEKEGEGRAEPTTIALREREPAGVLPPVFEATSKEGIAAMMEERMGVQRREPELLVEGKKAKKSVEGAVGTEAAEKPSSEVLDEVIDVVKDETTD